MEYELTEIITIVTKWNDRAAIAEDRSPWRKRIIDGANVYCRNKVT